MNPFCSDGTRSRGSLVELQTKKSSRINAVSKIKTIYTCSECATEHNKWQGQCGQCSAWNTLTEGLVSPGNVPPRVANYSGSSSSLVKLSEVKLHAQTRLGTGLSEFDHALGGGLVSDSVVLIGGDPGVGKSTLLLQIVLQLAKNYRPLYVTGEESLQQVAMRAQRLGGHSDNITLLAETSVEKIITHAKSFNPEVLVVDSIQAVHTEVSQSAPGSVGQVRESAARLVRFAKQTGTALFIIGHVTKEGAIAGPRVLEHMVDAVLYFEGRGDTRFRVIRAVKNRFGAVNEIGVFSMSDKGLKQVNNPSAIFLSRYGSPVPGSTIMVTWEGSRPLLVEVQALVDDSNLGNPRRVTVGLDHNRLAMLLAILHRHGQIVTHDQDVFVNVVGGLRVVEPGADLALLLAVLSSLKNKPISPDQIAFGELGLSGEIRPVPSGQERLREAVKHGFKRAIIPKANAPKDKIPGMEVIAVEKLSDALQWAFE